MYCFVLLNYFKVKRKINGFYNYFSINILSAYIRCFRRNAVDCNIRRISSVPNPNRINSCSIKIGSNWREIEPPWRMYDLWHYCLEFRLYCRFYVSKLSRIQFLFCVLFYESTEIQFIKCLGQSNF